MFDTRGVPTAAARNPASSALTDPRLRPTSLAAERALAVPAAFSSLLPGGLPRGATVTVHGVAGPAFALGLLGPATQQGSWLGVVGLGELGWLAAAELGVDLARTVAVHPVPPDAWPATLAALIDGFDAVLVGPGAPANPSVARRLAARARERSTVLVRLCALPGGPTARGTDPVWSSVSDISVDAASVGWEGLAVGAGRLLRRRVRVQVEGRRVPGRRHRAELWLPAESGAPAESAAPVVSVAARRGVSVPSSATAPATAGVAAASPAGVP